MKIMIVRHADPDYAIDGLTEKGKREAACLADRLIKIDAAAYYVSPLGRARATADYTLSRNGRTAEVCEWLREFQGICVQPGNDHHGICWDWYPDEWSGTDNCYHPDRWSEIPAFADTNIREEYDWVVSNLDALLEKHGYKREGRNYRAVRPNNDTILLFCHFGVESVLLSHLLNISPMVLWHATCELPSSVTTVVTEERREGSAIFRALGIGDLSHLYAAGEPASFAARFCECFANTEERH